MSIAAMIILAVLIFLITGHVNFFESNVSVYTYMADAAALTIAAPVNLNGIQIGKVKNIVLSGSKEPQRLVRIEMELPEHWLKSIPIDSVCSISAANILGTKYINIKSGKSETTVRPGEEIPSLNTAEFENVVQQGYAVLTSLQGTVEKVDKTIERIDSIIGLVEAGKGSIGKLLVDETLYNHFLAIVDEVKQLADALNSDQGTAGLLLKNRDLYDELHKSVVGVRQIIDDLNAGKGTAGKILKSDELHQQISASLSKIDAIIDKINAGQGTIGQLLVNQQLYDNLNGATREMHLLMKDFRANPKKFLRIKLGLF